MSDRGFWWDRLLNRGEQNKSPEERALGMATLLNTELNRRIPDLRETESIQYAIRNSVKDKGVDDPPPSAGPGDQFVTVEFDLETALNKQPATTALQFKNSLYVAEQAYPPDSEDITQDTVTTFPDRGRIGDNLSFRGQFVFKGKVINL